MKTQIQLAFILVILIWSTTPLAINWSIQDVGFLFGLTTRMILGGFFTVIAVLVLRYSVQLDRKAMQAYFASGIGIYVAMLFGYWGASYIPSGWISVLWGLSPIFTGILAHIFLGEKTLTWHRMLGALLGVAGLAVIFLHSTDFGDNTELGVLLIFVGVLGQTGSAVWIKHINAKINGLVMTTGGLLVCIPMFILTWWVFDGSWPERIESKVVGAIVYLAFFGSLIGFTVYYFLLNHVEASKLSLITLVTPVTALLLGHYLNSEALGLSVIMGTALILLGLLSYEWGYKIALRLFSKTK